MEAPCGGLEKFSTFQISPVSVTTYAVFLMNSTEVGRSKGSIDGAERAVPVHLHEAAGVRRRRSTRRAATEAALREGVEIATAAELHVDEEWGTGGHLSGAG